MDASNQPSQLAARIADAICDRWQVGTSSRFCDDYPDWYPADREEVARLIDEILDASIDPGKQHHTDA